MRPQKTKTFYIDTRTAIDLPGDAYDGRRMLHYEGETNNGRTWTPENIRDLADEAGFPISVRYGSYEEIYRVLPTQEQAHRSYPGPYREE